MAMTIHVDIVSAEKSIFSGRAEMVFATGALGELGIAFGHAQLLTLLKPGQVRLRMPEGKEEIFYISGGILEVQPNIVSVLANTAERAENLDEAAAIQAQKTAQDALANRNAEFEYAKASTQLAEAVAQIQAIKALRKKMKR
ncbi:MAG: ATP synthase epsilon chain [Legionellaceae bacterium]